MEAILFTAGLSFAIYCAYMMGRCAAIRDLMDGNICEDLEYWKGTHSKRKE